MRVCGWFSIYLYWVGDKLAYSMLPVGASEFEMRRKGFATGKIKVRA